MPELDIKQPISKEDKEKIEAIAKEITKRFNQIDLAPILAMQESIKKVAESFAPPASLIETLKKVGEQQTKMIQNLASMNLPRVDLDHYTPRSGMIVRAIKPRSEYLLEYQNQLLEEILENQTAIENKKPYEYYPETKTLVTRVVVYGAINFSTRRGTDSMSILFEILYELLEERGVIQNGYKTVFATGNEILQKAIQKGIKNADMNWLKHTRSNLVNSKIPHELKEIIVISEYNNRRKGYEFKIRVGEYLVN